MTNYKILFCLCISLLFFNLCCNNQEEKINKVESESINPKLVSISKIKNLFPNAYIEYVGIISAYKKFNIISEIGGAVEKLNFEKGDRVKKRDLLAEVSTSSVQLDVDEAKAFFNVAKNNLKKIQNGLRPEEIKISEAGLIEAKAHLKEAENNFNRMKSLYKKKAISKSKFDLAKKQKDIFKAKVQLANQEHILSKKGARREERDSALANLNHKEAILKKAIDRLNKSKLFALGDGIIAFRNLEIGEIISPGTVITKIIDNNKFKINISINEKDIKNLKNLKNLDFSIDAIPDKIFTCSLFFLSPMADPLTKTFKAEFIVNQNHQQIADGMTIRLRLPLLKNPNQIKIPAAWISHKDDSLGVFIINNSNAEFRKISLGNYFEEHVEILSGLKGDELIITNPSGIKDGDLVVVNKD